MSKFCPNCGAELTSSTGFCSECGAKTEYAEKEFENKQKEDKIKQKEEFKENLKNRCIYGLLIWFLIIFLIWVFSH